MAIVRLKTTTTAKQRKSAKSTAPRKHVPRRGAGYQRKNGLALSRLPAMGDKTIDWPAFGSAFL
jgi:hypothetical protein